MSASIVENIKDILLAGTQKPIVGISLTPGLGLEALVYDKKNNIVKNYGRKRVDYNFSTREIQDYMQFKSALAELMSQMEIMPQSLAYISLPNIYFDFMEVPITIADEEIQTAVLSKAEEFYLFKKEEPASGWCEVINSRGNEAEQRRVAYSSIQRNVIEELKEIFADVGLKLIGIESAYSTTMRGLYLAGFLDDVIEENAVWSAMVINTNSFTMFYFEGKNLLDCSEVPIAIKSFSPDEAYSTIASSASQLMTNFQSSKLYIISQTDDLGAEVLKGQMQFDGEMITLDSSKYSEKPLVEVEQAIDFAQANSLSFSAIGASCPRCDFNLTMNILADDPEADMGIYFTKEILGVSIDVTSELIMRVSLAAALVIALVFALIWLFFFGIDKGVQSDISSVGQEISKITKEIEAETKVEEKKDEVDINSIIDEVAETNISAVKFFDSIATDIPKDIWLTKYYNKDGNQIVIQGIADNIVDVYEYFKNLKITSPQSDIKLQTLRVLTDSEENIEKFKDINLTNQKTRLYFFEISNTTIGYESMFGAPEGGPRGGDSSSSGESGYSNDTEIIKDGFPVEQLSRQAQPVE